MSNCQNAAWSEEDELNLTDTCAAIRKFYHRNNGAQDLIDWLKSLKQRYTWKPSEEQMEALESAMENCAYSEYQDCLRELIVQLKKL